jgi:hypothetical protein
MASRFSRPAAWSPALGFVIALASEAIGFAGR